MRKKEEVVDKLKKFIRPGNSPFNYERYLLMDKASYLDAFIEDKPFPPFEVEIQVSSKCNLQCRWCIGDEIQEKNYVMRLPNYINEDNVDRIVEGIVNFKINNLGIEVVKFSGFIGEPLLNKKATLKAMQRLVGMGFRIGLFTNGVLMTEDTWRTLANIDYVHVSLDSGPSSFFWLKESPKGTYTQKTFYTIINNIKGLNATRKQAAGSKLKINIGYIIVPGNHEQIYETAKLIKEAGADSIRFKCDIGERFNIRAETLEVALNEIEKAKQNLEDSSFTVHTIHSKEDIENRSYKAWQCNDGCFYHNFVATIGSDGNIYLCDHNSMPGAIPLGNAINQSFNEVWKSKRRIYLIKGVNYICQSNVCPPFGNRVNFFLKEIYKLKEQYGIHTLKEGINELRAHINSSN